jgi:hypothetical protein
MLCQVLPEKRVGSLSSQGSRLRIVMTAVMTREGVMAIRIATPPYSSFFPQHSYSPSSFAFPPYPFGTKLETFHAISLLLVKSIASSARAS